MTVREDSIFSLPSGVTTGIELVQQIRIWEMSRETISQGAVALADWVVEDLVRALRAFEDPLCPLADRMLNRVFAGTVLPGDQQGEWLGRVTEGRVTAQMFRRAFAGDVPEQCVAEPEVAPEPDPVPAQPIAMLCAIPGPLGAIPIGPLFTAIGDPMVPGEFVLAGMGIALRLSEDTAGALRRALFDGIRQAQLNRFSLAQG